MDPITEDVEYLIHRTWRNQEVDLEAAFLLTSFHGAGKCYVHCLRSKTIINLTHLWILQAIIVTVLARYALRCNSDMNVMEITSCFLVQFKAYSGIKPIPGTIIRAKETGFRSLGEPTTIILSNGHGIKTTTKSFLLYP